MNILWDLSYKKVALRIVCEATFFMYRSWVIQKEKYPASGNFLNPQKLIHEPQNKILSAYGYYRFPRKKFSRPKRK